MKRLLFMASLLLSAGGLVVACGQDGDNADPAPVETEPTGGTVDPEVRSVTGAFFLGSTATPATGYELWLVDQTAGETVRSTLAKDGSFSLPIETFTEDHVYSLHLVKNHVLIGSVDLSPEAGTQAAFYYGGGFGFSIGEVVVAVDPYGRIQMGASELVGNLGGGFALRQGETGAFDDFPRPKGVEFASLGSQLVVTDPAIVLHSFYLADANPRLYARDLAALSRLGVVVGLEKEKDWARAYVLDAGAWLRTSRVPPADDVPSASSPFWKASSYNLTKTDEDTYEVSIYTGEAPRTGSIMTFKMQPAKGTQLNLQRALGVVIGQPPAVLGAAADGGVPVAIDYTTTTGPNGLTRPLCQVDAVTVELAPPKDMDGDVIVGDFDRIDVEIDYYGLAGGKTTKLKTTGTEFAAPFNKVHPSTYAGFDTSWTPSKTRLRFALEAADRAAATHTVQVPKALFPAKLGKSAVYRARLRLYYRSSTSATEAATILWLEKSC